MDLENKAKPIQHAKVMGMLYGVLTIFLAVLFFSTGWIASNTVDQRLRAFTMVWVVGLFTLLVCLEMIHYLFNSGMNPLGLALLGILNIAFIGLVLAVFADLIVFDIADTPIALVVVYLAISIIGTLIVILWMFWGFIRARRTES